jgi:hypothetical protein
MHVCMEVAVSLPTHHTLRARAGTRRVTELFSLSSAIVPHPCWSVGGQQLAILKLSKGQLHPAIVFNFYALDLVCTLLRPL